MLLLPLLLSAFAAFAHAQTSTCATQLQLAAFEWFYAIPGASLTSASTSLNKFLGATCSIPFNTLTNELYANNSVANYTLAASVLVSPDYGTWTSSNASASYTPGVTPSDSTSLNIVQDYATAVCRGLPVAYLLNANLDYLDQSPVLYKLTGNGVQSYS
jgi:hypothetical protein